jgi:hypothetical protein
LQLPAIMQWLKQTFSVCFNRRVGRTGHVWGDRYWSRVVEGEPPKGVEEVAAETGEISFGTWLPDGLSPLTAKTPAETGFSLPNLRPIPASARLAAQTQPRTVRNR